MCTVSWLIENPSYTIFFNRDELKTRLDGVPPFVRQTGAIPFIAPQDPQGKGTWIGVNQAGFGCCLLNDYSSAGVRPIVDPPLSRGLIAESLLGFETQSEALQKLQSLDLRSWRPFSLLLFQATTDPVLCAWNGSFLSVTPQTSVPFSSSSFDAANVIETRRRAFPVHINEATLSSYHASHEPERSAYSVCMHRDEAQTVSFSKIRVQPETVEFSYLPASPCRRREFETLHVKMQR